MLSTVASMFSSFDVLEIAEKIVLICDFVGLVIGFIKWVRNSATAFSAKKQKSKKQKRGQQGKRGRNKKNGRRVHNKKRR